MTDLITRVKFDGEYASIETRTDGLTADLDPVELGEGPAAAIAEAISAGIRGISERARDGRRQLFNRSGKLANGISVVQVGTEFEIRAPPDRLQDPALAERLAELVSAIAAPLSDRGVQQAIDRTTRSIHGTTSTE